MLQDCPLLQRSRGMAQAATFALHLLVSCCCLFPIEVCCYHLTSACCWLCAVIVVYPLHVQADTFQVFVSHRQSRSMSAAAVSGL